MISGELKFVCTYGVTKIRTDRNTLWNVRTPYGVRYESAYYGPVTE